MLDLGDGTAVAFKVESHNHPSAVEPFQGAATGIGGILRDVIAMGARPIALLDGLWFGEPDFHFQQAVAGIGHYGNCVGVPKVGGQTVFDPAYAANCLVNAMCVGLLESDRLRSAKASGPGRVVVLYGATTGRDGIGGASVLASAELSEDDADKRPSVQVGDPFTGKKLIEVSLELVESGLVESLQDCGAAGLASSLSEMASDGAGIDVHLDRVPLREEGMEPWEIMISESQERMVAVVRPEMLDAVRGVCARWELPCTAIGEVTDSGDLRAFHDGDVVGEIPAAPADRRVPALRGRAAGGAAAGATRRAAGVRRRRGDRAVRPPRRLAHRPPAGARRCRPAPAAVAARARGRAAGAGARRDATACAPASRRRSAPRATSRAPAASRSASPTASTSATPRSPRSRTSSRRRSRGSRWRRRRSGSRSSPATSRSTTTRTAPRSRRRRSSAASGSCRTCGGCRAAGATGDCVLLATSPDGSLEAEAALIRFLWKAAPHLTLCHDVGSGGIAAALAEAAAWSGGLEADVELPADYDSRRGAAILACRPERLGRLGSRGFVEIGIVA